MKDRLGKHSWVNRFPQNPTQMMFSRFVRQPKSGLPDYLSDSRKSLESQTMSDRHWKSQLEEL